MIVRRRGYNFRYALIRARRQSGYSQKEVAEMIHFSRQVVSQAERGKIYLDDNSAASQEFFSQMENLYGIPREILRKRGK